jgi:hypothetical protein
MVRPADATSPAVLAIVTGLSLSRITLLLFLIFQAADGLMTYGAASVFGAGVEGNPLIATWMQLVGVGPAVFLAKLVSSAGGLLLYWRGVHGWLGAVTVFYAFGAVIPWLHVLSVGLV